MRGILSFMSSDQPTGRVERVGVTVRRPHQRWTPAVHAVLQYLRSRGFDAAPRVLGIDGQGREVLEWIEGESGAHGWAKVVDLDGLAAMARVLRRMHDASVGFVLPPELSWADVDAPATGEVICHGDFGPWNLVWSGLDPVGIIDWDLAHAGRRLDDVAYALEYVAPFRDDDEATRWLRYPGAPDRSMRIRHFCVAYGWGGEPDRVEPPSFPQMVELVDAVIDRQVRARVLAERLAKEGIEPQATWVTEGRSKVWRDRIQWSKQNRTSLIDT
jgi:hypothetical protein